MKYFRILSMLLFITSAIPAKAQDLKEKDVPEVVKSALTKLYPDARNVSWEKEKGNYEANWGGKSGEDNSVIFSPAGSFIEMVQAIPPEQLPASIVPYITKHYHGAKIKEAGKLTDAAGKHMFEVEIKGKDLVFDEKGNFLRED